MDLEYYYNTVPGDGLCRNNLIYTSLMSPDRKVFCQHYINDSEYHAGKNQVVNQDLMDSKWNREICYLTLMSEYYPDFVPKIIEIDIPERKIFLEIDGVDFWQQSLDKNCSFDEILPDWQEQMLAIIQAYRDLGWYKYSMHPSSYFIINGKLKSINYFFTYSADEGPISLKDHESHISLNRQQQMRDYVKTIGVSWNDPEPLDVLQKLCFDSFRTNYPADFIEKAKKIYD